MRTLLEVCADCYFTWGIKLLAPEFDCVGIPHDREFDFGIWARKSLHGFHSLDSRVGIPRLFHVDVVVGHFQ